MMNSHKLKLAAAALLAVAAASTVQADHGQKAVSTSLKPSEEVPVVSSTGRGSFKAIIDETNQTIEFELSYEALEGTPVQAHIHVGQRNVNGGVSVFLCGGPTPACPASPATITGTITPANIIGPAGQGVAPTSDTVNEFAELVSLILEGDTYANVHSTKFPGGEIRGQIRRGFGHK